MEIDNIIEKERVNNTGSLQPEASVVVVTYNTDKKLLIESFKSLFNQSAANFEVIVVDNSDKKDMEAIACKFPVNCYIKLKENAGLSIGRNIGISRAHADIVIFLDDDAIPGEDFIQEHINAYKTHDIVGLRGKALPRTKTIYNYLPKNYDLGEQVFPYFINLEGNSSFRKDILVQIGKFNSQLKGAGGFEGTELSYRIVNHLNDRNKLIYYPGPVIYHDYCGSFLKYFRKTKRHEKYLKQLTGKYPELSNFRESYSKPGNIKPAGRHSFFTRLRLWLIKKSLAVLLSLDEKFSRKFHRPPGSTP